MTELIGDSAAAPAPHILEDISEELAHRKVPHVPHTIYEELWHLAFWQQIDIAKLDQLVRCPSRPGTPTRVMSIRDQLISLAAHNSYHLARIVLLRQLHQAWPPPSGGFTW